MQVAQAAVSAQFHSTSQIVALVHLVSGLPTMVPKIPLAETATYPLKGTAQCRWQRPWEARGWFAIFRSQIGSSLALPVQCRTFIKRVDMVHTTSVGRIWSWGGKPVALWGEREKGHCTGVVASACPFKCNSAKSTKDAEEAQEESLVLFRCYTLTWIIAQLSILLQVHAYLSVLYPFPLSCFPTFFCFPTFLSFFLSLHLLPYAAWQKHEVKKKKCPFCQSPRCTPPLP